MACEINLVANATYNTTTTNDISIINNRINHSNRGTIITAS